MGSNVHLQFRRSILGQGRHAHDLQPAQAMLSCARNFDSKLTPRICTLSCAAPSFILPLPLLFSCPRPSPRLKRLSMRHLPSNPLLVRDAVDHELSFHPQPAWLLLLTHVCVTSFLPEVATFASGCFWGTEHSEWLILAEPSWERACCHRALASPIL